MKTPICELLGIEFPLLAFSHCRDVVAAVTNAGGFGVLGASSHGPEELEHELAWIDDQVDGKPYGVDIVCPEKFEGKGLDLTSEQLIAMVPDEHREYVAKLLSEHGLSLDEIGEEPFRMFASLSDTIGEELLDVSFRHPIKLIANALGVPPQFMIDRAKAEGVPVAALVGAREHAIKQVHAGVDVLVVQGTEAGGHCGEVTTMVLVPEVIEAIRPIREVPCWRRAASSRDGRWSPPSHWARRAPGPVRCWLTTEEAETAPYTVQKMLYAAHCTIIET